MPDTALSTLSDSDFNTRFPAKSVGPKPPSVPTGMVALSDDEFNQRFNRPPVDIGPSRSPVQDSGVPDFWHQLMQGALSLGGPPTQYAFDPEYRKTINQNIPGIAGGVASAMVGNPELSPGFLAGSPILRGLAVRGLGAAGRIGAGMAGFGAGEAITNPPKSLEDLKGLASRTAEQGVVQSLFEAPGMVAPATSLAYNRYRAFLRPTEKLAARGVVETGLQEGIPLGRSAAKEARAKIDEATVALDQNYTDNLGSTHDKVSLRKAFSNWIHSDPGRPQDEKDIADKVWEKFMDDKPSQIDLETGRAIKRNLTKAAKFGELDTPTQEARKALAHIIGDSENALDPDFVPLKTRIAKLVDFEKSAKSFVNRQYAGSPIPMQVAYPLAGAGAGAAFGAYTHRDPWSAMAIGATATGLRSPAAASRLTQFLAENPNLVKQLGVAGVQKLRSNAPITTLKELGERYAPGQ